MIQLREAVPEDTGSIFKLINPYADRDIILKREMEDILASIDNFILAVEDGKIIGAVSFYDYGPSLKEIRSLVVDENYKRSGIGSKLTSAMLNRLLTDKGIKVFALTYTPEFFLDNKFIVVDKNTLPDKIWKDCRNCKNRLNCTETAVVFNG